MALSANPAARSALSYITIGALLDVWSGIWFWYLRSQPEGQRDGTWWYLCTGLLLSGVVLIVIGLLIGRIGREARHADAPPAPPVETARSAVAQTANAANQAALQANAAGAPAMYGAPVGGVPIAGMPVAGMPMAGMPVVGPIPPAQNTQQHKV